MGESVYEVCLGGTGGGDGGWRKGVWKAFTWLQCVGEARLKEGDGWRKLMQVIVSGGKRRIVRREHGKS